MTQSIKEQVNREAAAIRTLLSLPFLSILCTEIKVNDTKSLVLSPPLITILLRKIKIKFSTFLLREKTKATSIFFNLLISNRERLKVFQYFVKQLLRNNNWMFENYKMFFLFYHMFNIV